MARIRAVEEFKKGMHYSQGLKFYIKFSFKIFCNNKILYLSIYAYTLKLYGDPFRQNLLGSIYLSQSRSVRPD